MLKPAPLRDIQEGFFPSFMMEVLPLPASARQTAQGDASEPK